MSDYPPPVPEISESLGCCVVSTTEVVSRPSTVAGCWVNGGLGLGIVGNTQGFLDVEVDVVLNAKE